MEAGWNATESSSRPRARLPAPAGPRPVVPAMQGLLDRRGPSLRGIETGLKRISASRLGEPVLVRGVKAAGRRPAREVSAGRSSPPVRGT